MRQLALVFVDIAFHRQGPDALPASRFLFGLVLAAYLTVSLVALQINWPLRRALGVMLLDISFYLMFFAVVLRVARRANRFWQTVTAVLGAETFLSGLALPLLVMRARDVEGGSFGTLATTVLLVVLIWSIDIAGFVLSRAIDRPYIVGVAIVIGYAMGSMFLGEFFFPAP